MNEARRKVIMEVAALIEQAQTKLTLIRDQESEALEALPENMQEGEKAQTMTSNVDVMSEILDGLSEQEDRLGEIE